MAPSHICFTRIVSFLNITNITKLERLYRATSRAITGCLSFSPISLLLSEAALPPIRVTPTHFTLSFYERALRLPTSFPISGSARHVVKPRLSRFSWRAFASTYLLMFSSTSSREAPLACSPSPPWNLPSFTVESTLSSSCSRSDPTSLAKVRLWLSLTLSHLMIWCFGQTVLFLFLLAKAALAYLPTALPVALRPPFSFQQAQYAQIFLLKPRHSASSLLVSAALTNLLFFYLTLALSSPPCLFLHLFFYLNLSGRSGGNGFLSPLRLEGFLGLESRSGRNCLLSPPVPSGYNGSLDTRFSRGTTPLMSWSDGERYSCLLQSLVVSLLSSVVSTLVFSRTVSSKFFDTQVPSISIEELVLPRHGRCILSGLRCNGHSLLLSSYLSRIGRIENPSCSACRHPSQDTSHLILHCPATDSLRRSLFGDSLSLYDLWSRLWRVSRLRRLYGLPQCFHPWEGIG